MSVRNRESWEHGCKRLSSEYLPGHEILRSNSRLTEVMISGYHCNSEAIWLQISIGLNGLIMVPATPIC